MYKYEVTLYGSEGDKVSGQGILNLHMGQYHLEFSQGPMDGLYLEGDYEVTTDDGQVVNELQSGTSPLGNIAPTVLAENANGLMGLVKIRYLDHSYHGMLKGKLVFTSINGWQFSKTEKGTEAGKRKKDREISQ